MKFYVEILIDWFSEVFDILRYSVRYWFEGDDWSEAVALAKKLVKGWR